GHDPVLYSVVDHLHEVAAAVRPAVEIPALGGAVYGLPPRSAGDTARAGSERGKDRIEALHHGVLAADHQAISALAPPDAAAGSDIHVMDAFLGKVFRAPNIVHVIGVAAVDDDVPGREVREHLIDGRVHGRGRDHQPHRPWRLELLHKIDHRRRADGFGAHQLLYRFGR